jgi:putative redox protein
MAQRVEVRWEGDGLHFTGSSADGTVEMASKRDGEGAGLRPMQALAIALGGCTGMDVLSILEKMRQPVEALWIEIEGEQAEEHPRRYTELTLTYHVRGAVDEARLRRAIELSDGKYCSVRASLGPGVRVTWGYDIQP